MLATLIGAFLVAQQEPAAQPALPALAPPFRVEAKGVPIAAVTGHAAPFVVDQDGDGVQDLIVGMFGSDVPGLQGGTARIYRNLGSNTAPEFGGFTTLLAGGRPAAMESS